MKNIHKTILFTVILGIIAVAFVSFFQIKANGSFEVSCSYLDPYTIDVLAFVVALFLIFEGGYRIHEHVDAPLKKQWSRSFRIVFGLTIISLHYIQSFYKVTGVF
jgi:hypothetical protein